MSSQQFTLAEMIRPRGPSGQATRWPFWGQPPRDSMGFQYPATKETAVRRFLLRQFSEAELRLDRPSTPQVWFVAVGYRTILMRVPVAHLGRK